MPDAGLSIAEAARWSRITVDTLRYYERTGLMPTAPPRTAGGTRRYHDADLDWVRVITRLRATGMSIGLIRRYAELVRAGEGNEDKRLELLETHRAAVVDRLETLTENLHLVDRTIDRYRGRATDGSPREPVVTVARRDRAPRATGGRSVDDVPVTPSELPRTLGALRESGHELRGVKHEIRDNLLAALREGRDPWPGIVGFENTVTPQFERALIAGHDIVLLGERGQGKTRLLRSIGNLLDEWAPVIEGSEIGEHPYEPITPASIRRAEELGDALPVGWVHRSERYTEKLATPDTAVADLIGDVDPVKVAEGRSLGDPETIHFGLVPRAHRGIVAINELPDLAERIQVALLNVMEERDIQVRGYTLRLPLDVLLVASANPEDYTNRGRIITPLKDRFGAEVRTHYPLELTPEIALVQQEADLAAEVPRHMIEIVARFTRHLRESSAIDQGSGVSARFAVAAAETVAAAALRRAAITGEDRAYARPVDLESVPSVLRGKLEFASGEEGREDEVLEHLLRRATADTARFALRGIDLDELTEKVGTHPVRTGERVPAKDVVAALPKVAAVTEIAGKLGASGTEDPGPMASAAELALEYLFLTRKLAKDESDDGDTVSYG